MTLSELIAEVKSIVQDAAWTDAMITSLINRGLLLVASGVILPGKYQLSPPLPELYSVEDITTSLASGSCELPDDFNRDLVQVINSDNEDIRIDGSFRQFISRNPRKDTGSVRCCSRSGSLLLYRDIPDPVETLTIHYYRTPDLLSAASDEPTCIPTVLHKPLLTGYACSQIFNQIEDGIEGQKINTMFWNNEFQQGIVNLEILVGHDALPDYYEDLTARIG